VAKKKKATRAGASKKARKRVAPRRPRKRAATPTSGSEVHPGLIDPDKVDLTYLKKDIRDHIGRLRGMEQTERVAAALKILEQARMELKNPCSPTMVIP
jgi:hypothetical protein